MMAGLIVTILVALDAEGIINGLHSKVPAERAEAAKQAAVLRDPRLLPELVKLLGDRETDPQWQAVLALAAYGEAAAASVVEGLAAEDEPARWKAENALQMIGKPALPYIYRGLRHRNVYVRRHCAWLLGEIPDKASIPDLVRAVDDEDETVRWKAAFSLKKLGPDALPPLIQTLGSNSSRARRVAAFMLGEFGVNQAIPALVRALSDPDADTRWKAAGSLAKLGDEAVPPTAEVMKQPNPEARRAAVWVIQQLAKPPHAHLLGQALNDADPEVRWKAAAGLKSLGDAGLPELTPALKSGNPDVRKAAIWAIRSIGTPQATEILGRLSTPAPTVELKPCPVVSARGRWAYQLLDPQSATYNLWIECDPADGAARIVTDWTDEKNYVLLEATRSNLLVGEVVDGKEVLQELRRPPSPAGSLSFLVKRRAQHVAVFLNNILVGRYWRPAKEGARPGIGASTAKAGFAPPRIQKVTALDFSDDFMRTSFSTGGWHILMGNWTVESTMEPSLSPNPFRCIGTATTTALCVTGSDFWDDYELSASICPRDEARFGVCFDFRDLGDYYLVVCDPQTSRIALSQAVAGEYRERAAAVAPIWVGHWYRLQVVASGGLIRVSLNGKDTIHLEGEHLPGGGIGLYTESTTGTLFDDIRVCSKRIVRLDPDLDYQPIEATCGDFSGLKTGRGVNSGVLPVPVDSQFRWTVAGKFVIGAAGLTVGKHLFKVSKPLFGKARVTLTSGGEPLEERPAEVSPLRGVELAANCVDGYATFLVDGKRAAEAYVGSVESVGLWTDGGVKYTRVQYEALEPPRPLPLESAKFKMHAHMDGWAARSGIWSAAPFEGTQVFWHKGAFYGAMGLEVEYKPGLTGAAEAHLFFAEEFDPAKSYHLAVTPTDASLFLRSRLLKRVPHGETKPAYIALRKSGTALAATVEGKPVIVVDAAGQAPGASAPAHALPLRIGFAGKGVAPNLDTVEITSSNAFDFLFEDAPTDWYPLGGLWKVNNRWKCSPQWSWLAGVSETVGAFWHRQSLSGNIHFELFAGIKMASPTPPYYPRIGDINFALCGDGYNLDSGYTFIYGGWNNTKSVLLRKGKVVAESASVRMPPFEGPLERFHRHWFHLQGTRTYNSDGTATLTLVVDGVKAFDFVDREPLAGGQSAIWTWNQGIMIARVRLYAEKLGECVLPTRPPASSLVPSQATFPLRVDFEKDTGEWKPLEEKNTGESRPLETVSLAVRSPGFKSGHALEIVNAQPGGTFAAQALSSPFDPQKYPTLAFDYRIPPDCKINLYVQVEGRPQPFEIVLTAPESGKYPKLSSLPIAADNEWHHAELPLGQLLAAQNVAALVKGIVFANYSDRDYLGCGIGGNHFLTTYWLDNFEVR